MSFDPKAFKWDGSTTAAAEEHHQQQQEAMATQGGGAGGSGGNKKKKKHKNKKKKKKARQDQEIIHQARLIEDLKLANTRQAELIQDQEQEIGDLKLANTRQAELIQEQEQEIGELKLANTRQAELIRIDSRPRTRGWDLKLAYVRQAELIQDQEQEIGELKLASTCQAELIQDKEQEIGELKLASTYQAELIQDQEQRIKNFKNLEEYAKGIFDQLLEERTLTTRGECADVALQAIARDLNKKLGIFEPGESFTLKQVTENIQYKNDNCILTREKRCAIKSIVDELHKLKQDRNNQNHSVEKRKRIQEQEMEKVYNATRVICEEFRSDLVKSTLPSLKKTKLENALKWHVGKKKNFKTVDSPPKSEDNGMAFAFLIDS